MANFLQFDYAGQKYRYMVMVFAPTEQKGFEDCVSDDKAPKFTMSYDGIRRIEYWNTMLDPLIRGRIDYLDMYGDVSVFIGMPYVYCQIILQKVMPEKAEGCEDDYLFSHTFIVTSIDLLDMIGPRLRYRLNLVSVNWWNFAATVSFSNYDKSEPETTTEILKQLFQQQQLKLNVPDSINVKDRIYYISTERDTLLDSYKHLLGKTFQSRNPDFPNDTICPIVYNDVDKEYYWMDVKDPSTYQHQLGENDKYIELVNVSLVTNLNQLMMQGRAFFGSANRMDKTDVYMFMRRVNQASYDFELGQFAYNACEQVKRCEYLASQVRGDYSKQKFIPFDDTQTVNQKPAELNDLSYYRTICDWEDHLNNFSEGVGFLAKCDTVVVNTVGVTSRRPGVVVMLNFDTNEQQSLIDSETIDQYKKLQSKMVGLLGSWFVTAVHHVLDFTSTQPTFRDNVTLGRNFRIG